MRADRPAAPLVVVVVVNYNGGDLILECLAALRRQTFRDFVTVVVDNGSSDGSAERVARDFPEVVLRPLGRNAGFAAGNNAAIAEVEGSEWVALLNPDAFPAPDWLQRLLDGARAHPTFDVFGSRLLMGTEGEVLDGIGDAYHVSGLVWREAHGCAPDPSFDVAREIFSPCAAAALYRLGPLRAVGGFDEDLFCYVEDVDLGFRLRLAGFRCLYLPQAVVRHVGSGVVGVHSDFQIYHGHRNLLWVYLKNMPAPWFWLFLPLHLAMHVAALVWFGLRGRWGVIARAKRDALRGIPRAWRKRRVLQAGRRVRAGEIVRLLAWNPRRKCP